MLSASSRLGILVAAKGNSIMNRFYICAFAVLLAACDNVETVEPSVEPEPAALLETPVEPAPPPEPAPLSAEQQAAANADINLIALAAYRDHAERVKQETGSYPLTKRSFRSAIGAFEDAANESLPDGERANLDLPVGAEMTQPGAIVYRSNGTDYKLIAQRTGDCSVVRSKDPGLIDPKRDYGPGDCIAYGYWTADAETW